jgi:hypothetical protein
MAREWLWLVGVCVVLLGFGAVRVTPRALQSVLGAIGAYVILFWAVVGVWMFCVRH